MEQNKQKTSQGKVWMDTDGILYQDAGPDVHQYRRSKKLAEGFFALSC